MTPFPIFASERENATTRAPRLANNSADALPIPLDAPVTMTTSPFKSLLIAWTYNPIKGSKE